MDPIPEPSPAGNESDPTLRTFRSEIETMKKEVDSLQIMVTSQKKPWYLDVSTLISVLALVFSFGTTIVSYHRTQVQDVQASRQELRTLLLRISAIPRENVEAQKKYSDDADARENIGRLYNAENTMLTRQAAEIISALPEEKVSATEYYEIGTAMLSAYNFSDALPMFVSAKQHSKTFNDEIGAIRSSAAVHFMLGHPAEGRNEFEDALNIFSKYPGYSDDIISMTNASTEIAWAQMEANIGNFDEALRHVDKAQRFVEAKRVGFDQIKVQIANLRQRINSGNVPPVSSTTLGPAAPSGSAPH